MIHVLVTNDDGRNAAGMVSLARAVADLGWHLTVALPSSDKSHAGTSLGHALTRPTMISPLTHPELPGTVRCVEVDAMPSAIVTLGAMEAFGPRPDLVLVGINRTVNVGRGSLHSATIGAALTAAVHGIRGVALSADYRAEAAEAWHAPLCNLLAAFDRPWPADTTVSVNLPTEPVLSPAEFAWTSAVESSANGELTLDGKALCVSYSPVPSLPPAYTDLGAVLRGQVALTRLHLPYATGHLDPTWGTELLADIRERWSATPLAREVRAS